MTTRKMSVPLFPPIYSRNSGTDIGNSLWPPRVVWARELGWLNVRDPWGQWHSIPAKDAPSGYVRLANQAKGKR